MRTLLLWVSVVTLLQVEFPAKQNEDVDVPVGVMQ